MINYKELRIGNSIFESGELSTVYSLASGGESFCKINDINVSKKTGLVQTTDEDRFQAIPLTSEILNQCGFVKQENGGYQLNTNVGVTFWKSKSVDYIITQAEYDSNFGIDIKYVHQLQNIYYSLTGEELQIKELEAV